MATGTQTQPTDQHLVEAQARYEMLKTREDALYKRYTSLPLTAHPLEVDAARVAYLQASAQTLPALCEVARLTVPRLRGIGFDSDA